MPFTICLHNLTTLLSFSICLFFHFYISLFINYYFPPTGDFNRHFSMLTRTVSLSMSLLWVLSCSDTRMTNRYIKLVHSLLQSPRNVICAKAISPTQMKGRLMFVQAEYAAGGYSEASEIHMLVYNFRLGSCLHLTFIVLIHLRIFSTLD